MRLLSWLAASSIVMGVAIAATLGIQGLGGQTTVLAGSTTTVASATNSGLISGPALPMNAGRAPLAPPPQAGRLRKPVHHAPAAPPPRATAPSIVVGSYQQILINRDRAAAGLRPLSWSSCLRSIAVANAVRMARQGYISHTNGPTLDLGCGLGYRAGENVGWWSGGINDAQLNSMFMNSPDHRANIMGPYHYVATAWAVAPNGSAYIAVEFS